jgi:hypothetical protein
MQEGAENPAHMRVVVDDEKTQTIEIDADHATSKYARARNTHSSHGKVAPLTKG